MLNTSSILNIARKTGRLLLPSGSVWLIFTALLMPSALAGPWPDVLVKTSGAALADFVPSGWRLLQSARGDLNRDGRADAVMILEQQAASAHSRGCGDNAMSSNAPHRMLVVVFARPSGGFKLAAVNAQIVLQSDEGGVSGDPLPDKATSIERGSFYLGFYGGSRQRWAYSMQFRLDHGRFRLIGYTQDSFDSMNGQSETLDFNLLTGRMVRSGKTARHQKYRKTFRLRPLNISLRQAYCWRDGDPLGKYRK